MWLEKSPCRPATAPSQPSPILFHPPGTGLLCPTPWESPQHATDQNSNSVRKIVYFGFAAPCSMRCVECCLPGPACTGQGLQKEGRGLGKGWVFFIFFFFLFFFNFKTMKET